MKHEEFRRYHGAVWREVRRVFAVVTFLCVWQSSRRTSTTTSNGWLRADRKWCQTAREWPTALGSWPRPLRPKPRPGAIRWRERWVGGAATYWRSSWWAHTWFVASRKPASTRAQVASPGGTIPERNRRCKGNWRANLPRWPQLSNCCILSVLAAHPVLAAVAYAACHAQSVSHSCHLSSNLRRNSATHEDLEDCLVPSCGAGGRAAGDVR